MNDATRARLGWASLAFGLASAIAYVVQRLIELRSATPIDPLLVIREAHTAYYWRAATAVWWGGVAFALVARGASASIALPRAAPWLVGALALALVFSTWWWP